MAGIGEFALGVVASLIAAGIQAGVSLGSLEFFQRRKINRRVEDATAEVVEQLIPFLSQEGIAENKQRLLIQTCVDELYPLTRNPAPLFEGSLDGQKIFGALYENRPLPQTVREEGLDEVYALLCPRIAMLMCKIPTAVKDWESQAWAENYRRFDEMATDLIMNFSGQKEV